MRIESTAAEWLLVSACLVLTSAPSLAGPICWINHIVKAEGGIDVYFIQKASLNIRIMKNPGATSIRYTASSGVVYDQGGHAQNHLFIKDGGEFSASQSIEDTCFYKVSASGKVGKLTAEAAMRLPGLEPVSMTQIIGTDGTVSQTEAATPR